MLIPKLDPQGRDVEYKQRDFHEISQIVHTWLFTNDVGHIEMDRDILGLDPLYSKGWQSMGVLHYLGLKKEFKGIFLNSDMNRAIGHLQKDDQNFSFIIELLENTTEESAALLIDSLYEEGKSRNKDFEAHYKHRLGELENTEGKVNQTQSRKEQSILRGILFKDLSESKCAICHRTLPTDLMVAAHIKTRSKCSTSERKNPNVVMPVCKVGCDDFFEKGYIIVDAGGLVRINHEMNYSSELKSILTAVQGNRCTHFNEDTATFFEYRRDSLEPR